jgi:hypothetical protein
MKFYTSITVIPLNMIVKYRKMIIDSPTSSRLFVQPSLKFKENLRKHLL